MINPISFFMIDKVGVKLKITATLLGLVVDNKFHFLVACWHLMPRERNFKTIALKRIRTYLKCEASKVTTYGSKVTVYGSYIYINFTYCPRIYMFGSKANNTKINKTQKQALRIVYDYRKSLDCLIQQQELRSTQRINNFWWQKYMSLNHLNPEFVSKFFK